MTPKVQKIVVKKIDEPQKKSLSDAMKSFNNILIEHKEEAELNEYRRIFYSLFLLFCILFLLWVAGLWYVKDNYEQRVVLLEQEYIDEIRSIQFVSDLELEEAKKRFYLENLDLDRDDSVTKYVDPNVSFNNLGYVPDNLVSVKWEYVKDSKWYITVHEEAKKNFDLLAEQFYNETQQEIVVVSGYRSYNYQKWIKDRGCPDHLCAKAGHSEHQSGYAIDIYSASTQAEWLGSNTLRKYFDWLNANAHVYGFHNPYQNGVEIDGYAPEPWHWRYLGVELATHLKQKDMTFGQYYYSKNPK